MVSHWYLLIQNRVLTAKLQPMNNSSPIVADYGPFELEPGIVRVSLRELRKQIRHGAGSKFVLASADADICCIRSRALQPLLAEWEESLKFRVP